MNVDLIEVKNKAIEYAKEAMINEDKGNYSEAFNLYKKSIEKLNVLMKNDSNIYNQDTYKKKAIQYFNAANAIKDKVDENIVVQVKDNNTEKKTEKNLDKNVDKKVEKKDDKKVDKKEDEDSKKIQEALSSCMVTEKPNVKWDDVAGLDKAKEALKEAIILPLRFAHLFNEKRKPWKGILLYGPPGTGKSFLAKACATEAKGTFYSVSASNIMSKWVGEAERTVRALFELARKNKPAVIFLDEIDSLLSARGDGEQESTRRVKTEFLVQMQGVGHDDSGILVLGATNIPWDLDPAVRRRFQKKIYISLPEQEARFIMFGLNVGKTPNTLSDQDKNELAEITEGYSGSDIATLTQEAIYEPLRICQTANYFKNINGYWHVGDENDKQSIRMTLSGIPDPDKLVPPDVTKKDFLKAFTRIRPTVSKKDLELQEKFTEEFGQEG